MTTILRIVRCGTFGWLCLALMSPPQAAAQVAPAIPNTIEFNRDIRPILSDKCFTCHGPDQSHRMTKLRFDVEEAAKQDLGGRFAIVAGDASRSVMIQRITAADSAKRMPPVASGRTLSEHEIGLLRGWVEQGAKWEKHWSFNPPKRPELPKVMNHTWAHSPIDYFVLRRLEQEGITPSPEADRAMLLRRVTLDLTGLPPTLAELDAFLADQTPNAYEKVVDRLLRSARYGERMAFPWMDAARYADSNGYQGDGDREMWRWRDWVIDAFNRNMPFNQFTVEQLAGDMLPNATLDQKIASGFNRNHRGNSEGGIIPEEYAVEYVVDRVETTSAVFLGLTLGCARCHDHKYDPLTQKEFYQFFSYFNNVPESGKARKQGNSPPFIKAPTPDQLIQLQAIDNQAADSEAKFAGLEPVLVKAQSEWEKSLDESRVVDWTPATGLALYYPLHGDLTNQAPAGKPAEADRIAWQGEAGFAEGQNPINGQNGRAASFDGRSLIAADNTVTFGYLDKFTFAAWIYPTAGTGGIITRTLDEPESPGYGFYLKDRKLLVSLAVRWLDDGVRVETEKPLDLNRWHSVVMSYAGTRDAGAIKIYVDGAEQKFKVLLDDLNQSFGGYREKEPWRIGGGGGPQNRFQGRISDVRVYDVVLTPEEVGILSNPKPINQIAALAPQARSRTDADKIRSYYLENGAPVEIQQAWRKLVEIRGKRASFYEGLPSAMVMEEMAKARETHVLIRGSYDRLGDRVDPGLPAILPPMPKQFPNNRLGLARWVVDPSNPLTARVVVNRFWQMYFGAGLVRTAENFGSQGEPPSHPELLDWLATEFVRTGWDVKAMQKTIVMSATYRQSSKASAELLQKDPENRLLARAPRFRLPPEMVRDQVLNLAGLLVERLGGPSVKIYQPEGLWAELSGQSYTQDHGDKLYRRGLYVYAKRTAPTPSMANFDASSRETCVVRQNLTNTPLQALNLMNDITYMEAARVFAQRIMKDGGTAPEGRIAFAFRLAVARPPNPVESRVLLDHFRYELDKFKTNPDSAVKFARQGEYARDESLDAVELAAYTSVASLILNLDEVVTKE